MDGGPGVNRGAAPVLATVYSDAFQVYSAKKFPGVIESTPLSKCFAGQGIKIPIRKEGTKANNQAEYDNDD
jgi:Velvet factor